MNGALVCGPVRRSTAVRAAALTVLAAGVAAPLVRRRLRLRPPVVLAAAAAAPVALCVLLPRSRARDFGTCALQMFAYVTAYKMPYDDPEALVRRVKVGYPVTIDRLIGGGTTPTLRLQRALGTPGSFRAWEKLLVWSHWVWFAFPHGTTLYLIMRHPERVSRGAARIYATFDLGLIGYWAIPTAPPWYAAAEGRMEDGGTPELRRMMVEYGEQFWRSGWAPLYGVLGGNPLAAMPSLHFATSVTAAQRNEKGRSTSNLHRTAHALSDGGCLSYQSRHGTRNRRSIFNARGARGECCGYRL